MRELNEQKKDKRAKRAKKREKKQKRAKTVIGLFKALVRSYNVPAVRF